MATKFLGEYMKHMSEKARSLAASHIKPPEVDVESARGVLTLTIRFQVRGVAQHSLLRHSDRLKSNVQELVGGVLATSRPSASMKRLTASLNTPVKPDIRAQKTKQLQGTIGVVSTAHLRQTVINEASDSDKSISAVARDLFESGLARFEERLWGEASVDVLREFARAYSHFQGESETQQWSLRITRRAYLQAAMLAREHGMSQSQLACWCIAMGLEVVTA